MAAAQSATSVPDTESAAPAAEGGEEGEAVRESTDDALLLQAVPSQYGNILSPDRVRHVR